MTARPDARVLVLVDHPRWTLGRWAERLEAWLPWTLEVAVSPPIHRARYDLIHCLYPPLWLSLRARLPRDAPVMLSFHSERSLAELPAIIEARDREGFRIHVGGVSRAIVERLAAHFDSPSYLPDGVFLDEWPARPEPPDDPPRLGMVGLLNEGKGFDELLLPFARAHALPVVTHWRSGSIDRFPEDRLLPPGFVSRLYARMDLYAMLSAAEGTPMPLLESMASGVAPLATATGAALELIEDGRNGFLVPERSLDGLERAFLAVPRDRAELHAMGRVARETVARARPGEASVAAYRQAYARAMERPQLPFDTWSEVASRPRALAIVAHPDDETLWMGGLRLFYPWWDWTIACVTATADSPRGRELIAVVEEAGAKSILLGLPDTPERDLSASLANAIAKLPIEGFDLLFTHGSRGEYGHAFHVAVHDTVLDRWKTLRSGGAATPRLFAFAPSDGGIEVRLPPVLSARKATLLDHYRSEGRRVRLQAHGQRSSGVERFEEQCP